MHIYHFPPLAYRPTLCRFNSTRGLAFEAFRPDTHHAPPSISAVLLCGASFLTEQMKSWCAQAIFFTFSFFACYFLCIFFLSLGFKEISGRVRFLNDALHISRENVGRIMVNMNMDLLNRWLAARRSILYVFHILINMPKLVMYITACSQLRPHQGPHTYIHIHKHIIMPKAM